MMARKETVYGEATEVGSKFNLILAIKTICRRKELGWLDWLTPASSEIYCSHSCAACTSSISVSLHVTDTMHSMYFADVCFAGL